MKYSIYPTSFNTAADFVRLHHRHLKKIQGHKFSLAAVHNNKTIGVIICGRPVNRNYNSSYIEFTRVCTLVGYRNLCSQLLASARKKAKSKGYSTAITYIRADEHGASLKSDNWKFVSKVKGRQWHGRKLHEIIDKHKYIHEL